MTNDDKALVERLKICATYGQSASYSDHAQAADRIEALSAENEQWRACARYDATMEGPVFKGWDRSALERCRRAALGDTK